MGSYYNWKNNKVNNKRRLPFHAFFKNNFLMLQQDFFDTILKKFFTTNHSISTEIVVQFPISPFEINIFIVT